MGLKIKLHKQSSHDEKYLSTDVLIAMSGGLITRNSLEACRLVILPTKLCVRLLKRTCTVFMNLSLLLHMKLVFFLLILSDSEKLNQNRLVV